VTDGARDQVNYRIPSMLISVLGSSEVLNSALSLKGWPCITGPDFFILGNTMFYHQKTEERAAKSNFKL